MSVFTDLDRRLWDVIVCSRLHWSVRCLRRSLLRRNRCDVAVTRIMGVNETSTSTRFLSLAIRPHDEQLPSCPFDYCITLYFRGRKISRKVHLKYFREKIFSRIYCSRENIFPRKYLPAKISSRENILSRKYLPAKISSRENIFPRFFSVPHYVG